MGTVAEEAAVARVTKVLLTHQIYVLIRHQIVIPLQDEAFLWVKVDNTQVGVVGTQGCPTAENPSTGTPLKGAAAKGSWELCVLEDQKLLLYRPFYRLRQV